MSKAIGTCFVLIGCMLLWRTMARVRRCSSRSLCTVCGYDIRFSSSVICPECGQAKPRDNRASRRTITIALQFALPLMVTTIGASLLIATQFCRNGCASFVPTWVLIRLMPSLPNWGAAMYNELLYRIDTGQLTNSDWSSLIQHSIDGYPSTVTAVARSTWPRTQPMIFDIDIRRVPTGWRWLDGYWQRITVVPANCRGSKIIEESATPSDNDTTHPDGTIVINPDALYSITGHDGVASLVFAVDIERQMPPGDASTEVYWQHVYRYYLHTNVTMVDNISQAVIPIQSDEVTTWLEDNVSVEVRRTGSDINLLFRKNPGSPQNSGPDTIALRLDICQDGNRIGTSRVCWPSAERGPIIELLEIAWLHTNYEYQDSSRRSLSCRAIGDPIVALEQLDATTYWSGQCDIRISR